jgi:serine/threonine-protein kinase
MAKEPSSDSTISHYRIVSKIGEGGMGEVFLAEDTRLRRRVALKVLPEIVAADEDRLLRFEREAFAASALNHPNILTIFEFGVEHTTHFLVSEFVDGESLRERMSRSTMALTETLEIVIQIASALQAAHGAGIIHRDIKPDNVMIRADGYVKVLDFGLAKLAEPGVLANGSVSDPEAQTRRQLQTQAGIIMGTIAYMSPEQARGLEVDKRTDVWSLGCVLYEMLTRQQPFRGETTADALVNIIHREPVSIVSLRQDANSEIERIINRTLAKNRDERYADVKVLLTDLKQLQKRLEFEAELERSSPPNSKTEARTQVIRSATTEQSGMRNSIAVLPFSNLSADPDNDYFCDGLAEELLGALSKIDDLSVAARSSAFSFKGRNTNVGEIGKALSVKTVLEGSVRKSGNRVRITVQLVNVADGYHLWSDRYDREMQDIFDVQDEITFAIVDALRVKLLGDEKSAVLKRGTKNPEAYQLYLKGRFYWNKMTEEGSKKGIEFFEQAVALDPNYAEPLVGISDCYLFLGLTDAAGTLSPQDSIPKARAAAERALEINGPGAEIYASLAHVKSKEYDWAGAEEDYRRSLELNPNYPLSHLFFGIFLSHLERPDEALKEIKSALQLDPLSLPINAGVGLVHYLARRYDEAIEQLQKTLEMEQAFPLAHRWVGLAMIQQGRFHEAIASFQKVVDLTNRSPMSLTSIAHSYAVAGKKFEVNKLLEEILALSKKRYVSPYSIATVYAGLKETEKTLEWLEQAYAERNVELLWLKIDPRFDALRGNQRLENILVGMSLKTNEQMAQSTGKALEESPTVILSPATIAESQSSEINIEPDNQTSPDKPTNPKSEIGNSKSKWWLFGLLGLVVLAGGFFAHRFLAANKQIESIAVMPFVNASGNADVEYLSDGMTETLISSLSQVPNLSVKSRSTVFHYKGKETSAKKIGEELNVQAVLLGRVVERGEELNLNLELVNTQTQNVIWTGQYNRKHADLVTLQSEIARDVSQKLERKLSGVAGDKMAKKYSANPDAYELYLRGRYHWNRRTVEDDLKGLDYFEKAVKTDPKFALAYVGISDAHIMLGIPDAMAGAMSPAATLPPARAAAEKAIELDPDLAEAYASRGHVRWKERDWLGAESDFKRSIQLNPNYSYAHLFYSIFLVFNGRFEEGLIESKRSVELDPYSIPIVANMAYVNYFARRPDEAIASGRRAVAFDNTIPIARQRLGIAYEQKGMLPEAIAEFQVAVKQSNRIQLALTSLAHAYALSGNKVEARKILAELEERSKQQFVSSYLLATVHVALGEKRRALELLEHAYQQNSIDMVQAKMDPKLDPLRDEPRFQELLKKIGFPE